MADIQITCINKSDRNSKHEGITYLGNSSGKWSKQQVIGWIEDKSHTFYTKVNGNRANIGVVNGENGKYLRTHADGKWNDNLLSLSECP
ncbi:DUF3892 domain-containing protein [Azospirillum brasilense]|uniref:DUF3892 domain-containing protein n=1 Tax=Azospirillum brasilense TaxID=192 RepID=UPI001EDAAA07|nr:DUF3892 domain-containing protein [Azospirillum brasilense]UKJ74486.1 DUF3892 domain-containing protein [Azospirillum brasilense]